MEIVLDRITVTYKSAPAPALRDVSLRFKQGEFVGVLGSSGAGKSTLIRCVNLLVKPSAGTVVWGGVDLLNSPPPTLRKVRSRTGMIFQQFHLVPRVSVLNNVLFGTIGARASWKNWLGYFTAEERARAAATIAQVGLSQQADRRVERLSGGQQQRVAIARMVMQQPRVVLGDEPVSSLDPVTSRSIMDILRTLHEERGLITVMNLHDVVLAKEYATRIVGLRHGEVVYDGPPEGVTDDVQRLIFSSDPV